METLHKHEAPRRHRRAGRMVAGQRYGGARIRVDLSFYVSSKFTPDPVQNFGQLIFLALIVGLFTVYAKGEQIFGAFPLVVRSCIWRFALHFVGKIFLFAAAFCVTFSGVAKADDDTFFVVSSAGLACVSKHVSDYEILSGEVIFVSMSKCTEEAGGQISLFDQVQNSAPTFDVSDEVGPDDIVALSSEDLACIESLDVTQYSGLYEFYPLGCRLVGR